MPLVWTWTGASSETCSPVRNRAPTIVASTGNLNMKNATHQLNRRAGLMKIQQRPQKMTAGTVLAMQLLADAGKIRVQKAPDGTPIVNQEDYETWLSKLTAAPR